MIRELNNKEQTAAKDIHNIFQVSYAIEAELLGATNFPPLQRTIVKLKEANTDFYGYWVEQNLAAVMEIDNNESETHICSLVVDPKYFRRGIAKQMLQYARELCKTGVLTVETGAANNPAVTRYKNFGFIEIKQFDTDHGIKKVAFILKD